MDTWGALTNAAMSRDDLSIRRKTGIVSSIHEDMFFLLYASMTTHPVENIRKKKIVKSKDSLIIRITDCSA